MLHSVLIRASFPLFVVFLVGDIAFSQVRREDIPDPKGKCIGTPAECRAGGSGSAGTESEAEREAKRGRETAAAAKTWYLEEGLDYYVKGDFDNAIASFEDALLKNPNDPDIEEWLARAQAERNRARARPTRPGVAPTVALGNSTFEVAISKTTVDGLGDAVVLLLPTPRSAPSAVRSGDGPFEVAISNSTVQGLTNDVEFRRADRVLVTGMGSVVGYVRRADGKLQAAAIEGLANQQALNNRVNAAMDPPLDPKDRDLVVGLASTHHAVWDLINRVVGWGPFGDQSSAGAFTARSRPLYAALRNITTVDLQCHSNGAMVCLRAVAQGDITSSNGRLEVHLLGPQITPAAADEWRQLLQARYISGLHIHLLENDPVAPASFALGNRPWSASALYIARTARELLTGDPQAALSRPAVDTLNLFSPAAAANLKVELERRVPGVRVTIRRDPSCFTRGLLGCHYLSSYQSTP